MFGAALLIVDIQRDYFPGGSWPVEGMEKAAKNAAMLLEDARETGLEIVHVRHEAVSDDAAFFRPGTEGAEIHPMVAPHSGEMVILKHRPNSFLDTGLERVLRRRGIKRIVLAGAMSQMCIDATARAAADLGYEVIVAHDACAARQQIFGSVTVPAAQVHAAIMSALDGTYATVLSTRKILRKMSSRRLI